MNGGGCGVQVRVIEMVKEAVEEGTAALTDKLGAANTPQLCIHAINTSIDRVLHHLHTLHQVPVYFQPNPNVFKCIQLF